MSFFFTLCSALSVGVIAGFLAGALKVGFRARRKDRPRYSEVQVRQAAALRKQVSTVLKFATFLMLALGLIWCVYYLVLGAVDASQAEYATAMSQLIVSVLTIVSIVFAFFEFVRASTQREDAEARETQQEDAS